MKHLMKYLLHQNQNQNQNLSEPVQTCPNQSSPCAANFMQRS